MIVEVDCCFVGFEMIEYCICSLCLFGLGCLVIVFFFVLGNGFMLCVIVVFGLGEWCV